MPARFLGKRKKKKKRRLQTGADFDGDAYESEFDKERLTGQILRVFDVMQDGHHHTVPEVCGLIWKKYGVEDPEPSISAQIRNLRKGQYGSHDTPRRHRGARKSGLWEFKLYVNDDMSELTLCNFCQLQRMRKRAKERGVTVILGRDDENWVTARYSDGKEPSAYFMELTERCAC